MGAYRPHGAVSRVGAIDVISDLRDDSCIAATVAIDVHQVLTHDRTRRVHVVLQSRVQAAKLVEQRVGVRTDGWW